jgi:hypothetical protein
MVLAIADVVVLMLGASHLRWEIKASATGGEVGKSEKREKFGKFDH